MNRSRIDGFGYYWNYDYNDYNDYDLNHSFGMMSWILYFETNPYSNYDIDRNGLDSY